MDRSLRIALAANIKERRRILGLSQAQLAERAEISPGYVGEIEIARKFPTPEILQNLALALEQPAYRLLMTGDDLRSEADAASRQQAYEVALRLRERVEEELRELSAPFPFEGEDPTGEPA